MLATDEVDTNFFSGAGSDVVLHFNGSLQLQVLSTNAGSISHQSGTVGVQRGNIAIFMIHVALRPSKLMAFVRFRVRITFAWSKRPGIVVVMMDNVAEPISQNIRN